MKISVVFVGTVEDRGFNASALAGVVAARRTIDAEFDVVEGIPFVQDIILARLRELASISDGAIIIGGQGNIASPIVAAEYPDKRFAVVQGNVTAPNLASYDVLQEQSAFLGGCLAGLYTSTGTVGHLSGHRVRPGLKGRAAFVAGVAHVAPNVEVLTGFCGTQDDNVVTEKWAAAEIARGADVLFTMLNDARGGAIAACRRLGAKQIGNASDWTSSDPDVFIGSAIARIDLAVLQAAEDMVSGHMPGKIVKIGLSDGDAVSLAVHPDISPAICERIGSIAEGIKAKEIEIPDEYSGPEYTPELVE